MRGIFKEFSNKRITVMGLGRFGGGVGAARFLVENGALVTVTDLKTESELADSIKSLDGLNIRYVLGRHDMSDFTDTDMVIVNPAVPFDSPYIKAARDAKVDLETEIGLFVERCLVPICGITGSNGKTTTVSMLGSILEKSGRPFKLGGNIGGSLLPYLDSFGSRDIVVLELSSFQLEWLRKKWWSPHIGVVLNVLPNHLDRHSTFEEYKEAKAAILDYQKSHDFSILVHEDPGSRSLLSHVKSRLIWTGPYMDVYGFKIIDGWIARKSGRTIKKYCEVSRLKLPGRHMLVDALTAAACAWALDIEADAIAAGLEAFNGIPHRLEQVGEKNGILFFNDSKATTPDAAAAGVESFEKPVNVILGGYDKRTPFEEMGRRMTGKVRFAAVIGQTAGEIAQVLRKNDIAFNICDTLDDAFKACTEHTQPGDIVLLSPGCASYDMFANYEERGDAFKRLVKAYIG